MYSVIFFFFFIFISLLFLLELIFKDYFLRKTLCKGADNTVVPPYPEGYVPRTPVDAWNFRYTELYILYVFFLDISTFSLKGSTLRHIRIASSTPLEFWGQYAVKQKLFEHKPCDVITQRLLSDPWARSVYSVETLTGESPPRLGGQNGARFHHTAQHCGI